MSTTVVRDVAVQLSTTFSMPYQIRNVGDYNIYLGKDTSVSPSTRDWTLAPGDTLQFAAETFLYMVTDPGLESLIEQQYGALGNFTPGPSRVTTKIVNTTPVAQTLPNPHANAFAWNFGPALSGSIVELGDTQSITLHYVSHGGPGLNPVTPVDIIVARWFDDTGFVILKESIAQVAGSGVVDWTFPRLSNNLAIVVNFGTVNSLPQMIISLSTQPQTEAYAHAYLSTGFYGARPIAGVGAVTALDLGTLNTVATFSTTGAAVADLGVPHVAGENRFTVFTNGGAANGAALIRLVNPAGLLIGFPGPLTAPLSETGIFLPRAPLVARLYNPLAAGGQNVILSANLPY